MNRRRSVVRLVILLAILAGSLGLNFWNNDFPLGDHLDEGKKVYFVEHNTQDFQHPLLMLQLAKAASLIAGCESETCILRAGRSVSGILGTLVVAATFLLARQVMAHPWDLLATAAVAATPLIVIHAHYFKEDITLAALALPALLLLLRMVEDPRRVNFVGSGNFGIPDPSASGNATTSVSTSVEPTSPLRSPAFP